MKPMNLCIIENGLVAEDLKPRFFSYPEMIKQWLSPSLREARYATCSPVSGEPLPSAADFDGYILTGSPHSSYEQVLWIRDLRRFLKQAAEFKRPMFGICFGHQVMADTFGGRTCKAHAGWGVGAQQYTAAIFGPRGNGCYVFHQDQVEAVPLEATVIGGSEHSPNGMLEYSFPALSVQFHPEFTSYYVKALANKYNGNTLSADASRRALDSLEQVTVDNHVFAEKVADFFRRSA